MEHLLICQLLFLQGNNEQIVVFRANETVFIVRIFEPIRFNYAPERAFERIERKISAKELSLIVYPAESKIESLTLTHLSIALFRLKKKFDNAIKEMEMRHNLSISVLDSKFEKTISNRPRY